MGLRKTVPSRMPRRVPLGEGQAFFSPYSPTRSASGVMVAHFTPTPTRAIALAAATVTASSVRSRSLIPRS